MPMNICHNCGHKQEEHLCTGVPCDTRCHIDYCPCPSFQPSTAGSGDSRKLGYGGEQGFGYGSGTAGKCKCLCHNDGGKWCGGICCEAYKTENPREKENTLTEPIEADVQKMADEFVRICKEYAAKEVEAFRTEALREIEKQMELARKFDDGIIRQNPIAFLAAVADKIKPKGNFQNLKI